MPTTYSILRQSYLGVYIQRITPAVLIPHPTSITITPSMLLQRLQKLLRRRLPVPLRVILRPLPQILTRILERQLRLPSELLIRETRIRREIQHIALPSRRNLVFQIAPHDLAKRVNHLEDCGAAPGTQVPRLDTRLLFAQVVQRLQVAAREVEHVDVITDRSAVFGLVVVAKDEEFLALANSDGGEEREQVVGDAEGVFTHDARGVGARGVEVAEEGGVPLLCFCVVAGFMRSAALRVDGVGYHALDSRLGAAVDVGGADGAVLGNRDHVGDAGRVAVDSGGRGEDDIGHVVLDHGGEERDRPADVDTVVCEWDFGGLANGLGRS
jgi:hypothetical protein